MSSCSECAAGKYLEFLAQTACYQCPTQSTTATTGSASLDDCKCQQGKNMSSDRTCLDFWKVGVQHNILEADVLAGGWTKCYEKTYADTSLTRADLSCDDAVAKRFAFAVKQAGSDVLHTLAMGSVKNTAKVPVFPLPLTGASKPSSPPYDTVGNPLGEPFVPNANQALPQIENGVYWYITDKTFGFSPIQLVDLNDFDMSWNQCKDRVGWAFGASGHRVGCICSGCSDETGHFSDATNVGMASTDWIKVIYKLP